LSRSPIKTIARVATPPSAHDVARLAGVSQAAVSRAYTPGASISPETRERVLRAAEKIGYRPNLIARTLIRGRSDIVGVVMGNPKNPAHVATFESLSNRLTKAGKLLLLFTAEEDDCAADVHVEDLLKYRVDALVLISANLSSKISKECRGAGIPVIFLSRLSRQTEGMSSVTVAAREGGRKIAEHLLQQGYRRLAYMVGFSDSETNLERETAFTDYVSGQRISSPQRIVGHFRREGAMAAARNLLSQRRRPDAIFCATDYMAIATIEVARYEFGLNIGRELGVAGFDDIEQAAWPSFDLTTYSQPIETMINRVIEMIQRAPESQSSSRIVVEGELKCRGSTRRR
jgi:DNA-binding LacI/PurR family transcriptional regulator